MALPAALFSPTPVPGEFLAPDDRVRPSLLVDYEMGGVALGDPSQGLQVQVWEARVDSGMIQVRPEGVGGWTDVVSDTGISEIALAFDQNMRPTVAYVASGVAKMRWFDAVAAAYVISTFAGATSPVVTMDDKRPAQIGLNDIVLFYLRGGRVYYRVQRERFINEYDLAAVPENVSRIKRWGMTDQLRVQLEFGLDVAPGPATGFELGDLYTDTLTDTCYAVIDGDIVPFFADGARTGVWRSKKIVLREHPFFAWLRLNGPMTTSGTVRIYADGALWHTTTISTREPVRLPPGRHKHWEIEIESTGRFSSIVLASKSEGLL